MQDAVHAQADVEDLVFGFDVDVGGALVHGLGQHVVHQFDDRGFFGQFAQVADVVVAGFVAGTFGAGGQVQQAVDVLGAGQAPLPAGRQAAAQDFVQGRVERVAGHDQHAALGRLPAGHAVVHPPVGHQAAVVRHVVQGGGIGRPFGAFEQGHAQLPGQHRQQRFFGKRAQANQDAADAAAELLLEGQGLADIGARGQLAFDQQVAQPAGRGLERGFNGGRGHG